MKFMDACGNELVEGGQVSMGLGLLQSVPGTIVKTSTGLGVGPDAIPHLGVVFTVPLAVLPNGMVQGVFAMPSPRAPLAA